MAHQTIPSDDRHLAVETDGDKGADSSILFVHGPGGDQKIWSQQLPLASDHRIVRLNLSGHGASDDVDADPGFETLLAYSADLTSTLRTIEPTYLVGHSLGAAVILHTLATTEIPIDGAVLTGAGVKLPVNAEILRLATENFTELVAFLHAPDRLFYKISNSVSTPSEEAMRTTGKWVTQRDFLTCDAIDVSSESTEIAVPSLILAGEYDRMVPPTQQRRLANTLSDSSFALVPRSAHMPMLEQPDAFNRAVAVFIEQCRNG